MAEKLWSNDEIYLALSGHQGNPSVNRKVGKSAQVWIQNEHEKPLDAFRSGSIKKICGDCPLLGWYDPVTKKMVDRVCYGLLHQAPRSVHASCGADEPSGLVPQEFKHLLRLGANGDPAFAPEDIQLELIAAAHKGWTCYTHQWQKPFAGWLRQVSMASVEKKMAEKQGTTVLALVQQAWDMGWKTFRLLGEGETKLKQERVCWYDLDGTQCGDCTWCAGLAGPLGVTRTNGVVIPPHGNGKGNY